LEIRPAISLTPIETAEKIEQRAGVQRHDSARCFNYPMSLWPVDFGGPGGFEPTSHSLKVPGLFGDRNGRLAELAASARS
jgi:hypothetical protein